MLSSDLEPHRITSYNVCYTKLLRVVDEVSDMSKEQQSIAGDLSEVVRTFKL